MTRDWQRVEARLRARADGFRRPRAGAGSWTGHDPHRPAPDPVAATGLLLHDPPIGAVDPEPSPGVSGDGRCADCAVAIRPERLRAAPHAIRCLGCQRVRDAAAAHG